MRSVQLRVASFLVAALSCAESLRADSAPELVQLVLSISAGSDIVGELVAETPATITVIDLKSGKQRTFDKGSVTRVKHDLSDSDAIAASDLSSVVAWKVNKLSTSTPTIARVAKVADSTVYLTVGEKAGLTVGQKMNVFRVSGNITDPVTHKVIAQERPRIAQLTVSEVQDTYAKAKLAGDLEVALNVGDEVETIPLKVSVAVVPLVDADGHETEAGVAIAEDMTTALVGKKVAVVERNVIKSVLKELVIQSSELFDPTTVQRLGKQIGASTVLTGKIVPDGNQSKIHLRLISVETGQVLLAASQTISLKGRGTSAAAGLEGGAEFKTVGDAASGVIPLGARTPIPGYLATKDSLTAIKGGGLDLKGNKFVHTNDRALFKGDFTLDLVCTKTQGDGILLFGIGELADANGEPPTAIKLRMHAPDLAEGYVGFNAPGHGEETIGHLRTAGTHLLRVEKKGSSVTISVYANYDGKLPDSPDMSRTIADISDFAPAVAKAGCVFFGDGIFKSVSLQKGP